MFFIELSVSLQRLKYHAGDNRGDNVNDFIIGNLSTGVIVGGESLKADHFLKILQNIT